MKILILPVQAGKQWNGATMWREALGGSEQAVAFLARALARKAHDVTVVTHGVPGTFDGVAYQGPDTLRAQLELEWDVLISSRWVDVLKYPWKTKVRLFWSHDLPYSTQIDLYCHKAVFLSQFHRSYWGLMDEQTCIIGNGVDLSLFQGAPVERDENKLVWISNPDRGLPLAAKIFQDVRKRWPDLELHVYGRSAVYGWGPEVEMPYLPRLEHLENVIMHEPLNKAGLATVLREAWALFYPSFWPETYCIAALEAQAAGTPVISVPLGALLETVKGGVLTYDILNAVSQLRNKSKWQKESEQGLEFARTRDWSTVADEWLALIQEVKNAQPQPSQS